MAEYQAHLQEFEDAGISVFAVSADPLEKAKETVAQTNTTFPVFYGLDPKALSEKWGTHYEERRNIFHATGYILHPDRKVLTRTASTGPVGRITAEDAIRIVKFWQVRMKEQAAQQ